MTLIDPFGLQTGLSLGLTARGTLTEETYDAAGDLRLERRPRSRRRSSCAGRRAVAG